MEALRVVCFHDEETEIVDIVLFSECYDSYILIVHVCGTRKIPVRILSHFVPMVSSMGSK